MALIGSLLNYIGSVLGLIQVNNIFEKAILAHMIINIFVIYFLRRDQRHYLLVVNFFIFSSLLLFYFVLLTHEEDQFRLIAFFLALFAIYVLLGRKYGLWLGLFLLSSILLISKVHDLKLSPAALATFTTFFIIFIGFLYLFFRKIENDALEFKLLSHKLENKINTEIEQREVQEQMLLRQYRMANMGEMLDSIAHQWRQPLMHINSILMNMDNALEEGEKDKNYLTDKVDEVASLTAHMSQTIEDFRGLFKTEQAQTSFTIESAVNEVIALMKNNLSDIVIDYGAKAETSIEGFKSELIQVFIIILSNMIEVFNSRNITGKAIKIDVFAEEKETIISIQDNAGGIPAEHLATIFDPYFTTKEQSGGTGLGLYIAKIIVEQKMLGKIIAINSAAGARFTIELGG
jgi:signal transduction histidine kinase